MVAVAPTTYDPAAVKNGAVTCSVVEALPPGPMVRAEELRLAVHPVGTAACNAKLEGPQPLLS